VSYFVDHLADVRLPVGIRSDTRLRRGQRGAIHRIAAHFSVPQTEPAIVVMPTGSGKTGVILLAPFLLEAERVLVVTPSRLVRSQIYEQASNLSLLRSIGVISPDLSAGPKVYEVEKRIATPSAWEELRAFDIVIGTTNGVSPGYEAVPQPPSDLFDLILVDEAHHSPARTWNVLLEAFPQARRVLFTATPFRRDSREIRGVIVHSYSIKLALEDHIFGRINYVPVDPSAEGTNEANDVAIAHQAEALLLADRASGYDHYVMVRIDSRDRADALAELYKQHTQLRLKTIHSRLSYSTIRRTIKALQAGELDGIICVNMLGEGFDFPNLKIAAIHSPHKSLAVTLQFIGRFARTNADRIGAAKFIAVPNDIKIEAIEMYREDAAWEELVPGLLEKSVDDAVRTREVLQTFQPNSIDDETDLSELSLYALQPFHHVKIYEVTRKVDLHTDVDLGRGCVVAYRRVSDHWNATIFITEEVTRPRWANVPQLDEVARQLFIVYYNERHRLLFICSSVRSETVYEQIAQLFCPGGIWPLTHSQIKKATLGLANLEFFNIGMRNRVLNNTTESYRTLAGSAPDRGIRRGDSLLYHEGHAFARGLDGDQEITIGLSSLSKVWSNTSSLVPDLLEWCSQLADRLASDQQPITGSALDLLGTTQLAKRIPTNPIAADWDKHTYTSPCQITYHDEHDQPMTRQLLDFDLMVDTAESDSKAIRFAISGPDLYWPLEFRLDERPHIQLTNADQQAVQVARVGRPIALIDYLNAHPVRFYFADFSSLIGRELLMPPAHELLAFAVEQIEAVDWAAENVDIQLEFGSSKDGRHSIHDYLARRLLADGHEVVLYDHGSGELGDYLAVREDPEFVQFELYHCKGSKEPTAGDRVSDLYEVCGQVVKSVRWFNKNDRLRKRVRERVRRKNPSQFLAGDLDTFIELLERANAKSCRYRIVIVQPGVSRNTLSAKQASLLAMAADYVGRSYCEELTVLGSL